MMMKTAVAIAISSIIVAFAPAGAQYEYDYRAAERDAERELERMSSDLADKESEKYFAVAESRNATAIDLCVQAGMVAQSYLQANRYAQYDYWKGKENRDCRRAGVR